MPIILYTGATGMMGILDVPSMLGSLPDRLGMDAHTLSLWLIVWIVGIIGSIYALFGGLRSVAVSDTLNGVGLLVGGFLITGYALSLLGGDGGIPAGASLLLEQQKARFNSVGNASESEVVQSGKVFKWIVAVVSMAIAPLLANTTSIFGYLQKMNWMYFIPIFAVVLMLVIGEIAPQAKEFEQVDVGAVDMTPRRLVKPAGLALIAAVFTIYATFADFSVLVPKDNDLSGSRLQSTSPK